MKRFHKIYTIWVSSKGNSFLPYRNISSLAAATREGEKLFDLLSLSFGHKVEGITVTVRETANGKPLDV
jgi:hypothetical protein